MIMIIIMIMQLVLASPIIMIMQFVVGIMVDDYDYA